MRLTDPDGYRQRAACICVRNEHEDEVTQLPEPFVRCSRRFSRFY